MIRHAMDYVLRAERVLDELSLDREDDAAVGRLCNAKQQLTDAESALVRAYGLWREGMELAAERGNKRAARYLEETTWDLT